MNKPVPARRGSEGNQEGGWLTVLRLHGVETPEAEARRAETISAEAPEVLDTAEDLLDDFLDRRASQLLRYHSASFARHPWKPKLALVLPAEFSADRPSHRRDLTVALEVLASATEHYNVEVMSDSPDALRLFRQVTPYSPEAVDECSGALVLLSRRLNDEVGSIRPSRFVGSDPCAFRVNKKRIVFESGVEVPDARVDEAQMLRDTPGAVPVFIDEDDDVPSYLEALRRLRLRGISMRITLSSRSDEDFARRVHAAFEDDPRAEVHDAEPIGFEDRVDFRISNEPIVLLTQRRSNQPRFLFHRGEFRRLDSRSPERSDFYLFRGEESKADELLSRWLGRRESGRRRSSLPRIEGVTEPLVSIVVPVYDRTVEILRMAHSIYLQDYPWIEVVFVSNGSPPETIEAMRAAESYLMKRRFKVRTLELPHACGSATIPRDLGIRAGSGEMICVLDSDDWLNPGFFAFLRGGGWREDTLYYPRKIFRDHGRAMRDDFPFEQPLSGLGTVESPAMIAALQTAGNFLCNSGVCCPRELFERSGGIDHRLTYGEDLYLWWRCARAGGRAEQHDGSVNISLHPGNNELVVGDDGRLDQARELAKRQEMTRWL